MMCEIWEVVTVPGDIERLKPKSIYSQEEIGLAMELEKYSANAMLAYGKLMTRTFGITLPGQKPIPLGVCGAVKQWNGFATIWCIFDEKAEKYPLAVTKAIMALINLTKDKLELRRISFTVRSDYTVGQRFAEVLGLKPEGMLESYLPDGGDVILYARVFK